MEKSSFSDVCVFIYTSRQTCDLTWRYWHLDDYETEGIRRAGKDLPFYPPHQDAPEIYCFWNPLERHYNLFEACSISSHWSSWCLWYPFCTGHFNHNPGFDDRSAGEQFHQGVLTVSNMVQNAKKNKEECVQFLEHIYRVLYAIVNLHIKSESTGSLPPAMLHEIGRFTEYVLRPHSVLQWCDCGRTLHKIYAFVEAQKEGNRIKTLFRQAEVTSLLKDGREGLKRAMEVFKASSLL